MSLRALIVTMIFIVIGAVVVFFYSLMSMCSRNSRWEEQRELEEEMRKRNGGF